MYGLPQVGIFASKLLKKHLAKHGYFKQPHTPGLWRHKSHQIWFNLVVDYFGIKCIAKATSNTSTTPSRRKLTTSSKTVRASYFAAST